MIENFKNQNGIEDILNKDILFEIIEQPNNWVKEMKKYSGSIERTVLPKIKDMLSWGIVAAGDVLVAKGFDEEAALLSNGHVLYNGEEMSMQKWLKNITGWKSVETYKFAIHKNTGVRVRRN